jgi:hypothetical protein
MAKTFCTAAGVFFFVLGVVGILIGDPALSRAWHAGPLHLTTGDHVFHVILDAALLTIGLLPGRNGCVARVTLTRARRDEVPKRTESMHILSTAPHRVARI